MANFKKAFVNENAIKSFREQSRLAAAKERVVHAALNDAACQVVRVYGPNISLDASKDSLIEIRPSVFSGKVEAQLSVITGAGLKRIAYPIEVRASAAVLPADEEVSISVHDSLEKTPGDVDAKISEYEKKIDEKIADCQAQEQYDQEVDAMISEEDLSKEAAQMHVFNVKAAEKQPLNTIPGQGLSSDSNVGINSVPQTLIQIDKNKLPTFNIGDPLDLNGTPYVCIKVGDVFVEFQLQVL